MELYSHAWFDEEVFDLTPLSVNLVDIVVLHVNKHQAFLIKNRSSYSLNVNRGMCIGGYSRPMVSSSIAINRQYYSTSIATISKKYYPGINRQYYSTCTARISKEYNLGLLKQYLLTQGFKNTNDTKIDI